MRTTSLKVNSFLNAVRMTLTVFTPMIMFPYTSRIFLTEGNGQINFVTSTVQIFSLFASLGIYGYGIREGAKLRNNKRKFSVLTCELLTINLISTVISYVFFLCLIFLYDKFDNYRLLLMIHGISIGFTALGLDWIFGTYEDYLYITVRQIILQIFTIVSMFLFLHSKEDIVTWVIILTVPYIFPNIYNYFRAKKYFNFVKVSFSNLKKHVFPILIFFASSISSGIYTNIDIFLLGLLSTEHNVGLYSAAVKVNSILIAFLAAMTPVFIPRIVQTITSNNLDEYYLLLKKIFLVLLSIAIPSFLGLEAVGREVIIVLAGNSFENAYNSLVLLAPIIVLTTFSNFIYYSVLIPLGKELSVLKCTLLGGLTNIVLSYILIHFFNEIGAAIGSVIAELLSLIFAFMIYYKTHNRLFFSFFDIKNYLIGSFFIVICCSTVRIFFNSPLLILSFSIIFSSFIYFVWLVLSKDYVGVELKKIAKKIVKVLYRNA